VADLDLSISVDTAEVSKEIAHSIGSRIRSALDEELRYGGTNAQLKAATTNLAGVLVHEVLQDPEFREEARAAFRNGLLEAVRARASALVARMPAAEFKGAVQLALGARPDGGDHA
jgi:hypothetical protein